MRCSCGRVVSEDKFVLKIVIDKNKKIQNVVSCDAIETIIKENNRKGRNELICAISDIIWVVERIYNDICPQKKGWMSTEEYEKEKDSHYHPEGQYDF